MGLSRAPEFGILDRIMRFPLSCLVAACFASIVHADVSLAGLFQDNLVFQRDRPVPIWGRADPDEKVTVTFAGQEVTTLTPGDGRWIVYLEPLLTQREPGEMVVSGNNRLTVRNILVGEVWLCSGQSNMAWSVKKSDRAQEEIAGANFPQIRVFTTARVVSEAPTDVLNGAWEPASPSTVGDFTAVGYFFARDLHRKLGVPIGIVNSSWGGSPVEAWMSPAALASNPAFAVVSDRWRKTLEEYPEKKAAHEKAVEAWTAEAAAAQAAGQPFTRRKPFPPPGPGHHHTPAGLFNAMINPVLPFGIRGVLWYQGEGNAVRPAEYHKLFAAMITYWRAHFGQGDFPFYWVQLANFKTDGDWAGLREAQTETLSLPETGQALAIDIGNPDDIHPLNKQEVARRLALIAKAKVYGIPGDYSGPMFESAEREKNGIRVRFTHAVTGLIARDRPLQSFELAGRDRVFRPARAVIEGDTVFVTSPEVKEPIEVRYAWSSSPVANLYNGAGLPATPFRSDDW